MLVLFEFIRGQSASNRDDNVSVFIVNWSVHYGFKGHSI